MSNVEILAGLILLAISFVILSFLLRVSWIFIQVVIILIAALLGKISPNLEKFIMDRLPEPEYDYY